MENLKKKLPPWAKKLLVLVGIVAPLCGAATTVVVTIIDIRAKTRAASANVIVGYETLAPALSELQDIVDEESQFLDIVDQDVLEMKAKTADLERRILYLEAYIDIISERGSMPALPPVQADAAAKPEPKPGRVKDPRKAKFSVPDNISEAKAYQQQRAEMDCSKDDPLCGARE